MEISSLKLCFLIHSHFSFNSHMFFYQLDLSRSSIIYFSRHHLGYNFLPLYSLFLLLILLFYTLEIMTEAKRDIFHILFDCLYFKHKCSFFFFSCFSFYNYFSSYIKLILNSLSLPVIFHIKTL